MDSVMFSHDPLSGVYSGITPCSNNHTTKLAEVCPLRLSMTKRRRSGGNLSHNVGFLVRPTCQRSQAVQLSVSSSSLGVAMPPEWPVTPPPTRRARRRLETW